MFFYELETQLVGYCLFAPSLSPLRQMGAKHLFRPSHRIIVPLPFYNKQHQSTITYSFGATFFHPTVTMADPLYDHLLSLLKDVPNTLSEVEVRQVARK